MTKFRKDVVVVLNSKIKGGPYDEFPYLDTLSYTDEAEYSVFTINNEHGDYEFNSTDGGYDGDDRITLHDGTRVDESYACYVESEGEYYREEDVVWTEDGECELIDNCVEVAGRWYNNESDDIVWSEHAGEHILRDDCVHIDYINDYVHVDDTGFCDITDEHILSEDTATGTLPNGDSFTYNNQLSQEEIDEYVKSRT